ncbi:uncharacterized protein LOC110976581 [Acanthaster planci]|uniref:Uncharacterized protein LOC110976581 n=1 Tax=Acanthaster planci TaxID=133434 RepID=A0A8B7Y047_ACAPL|nr:uncharacterized protein LOC110976581 [Acanthaster planci]
MLKFVRQGESGRGSSDEWTAVSVAAVPERKDSEHDCTVCKTRRRSLERQAAGALRRSRSRDTPRSVGHGTNSTHDVDVCLSEHAEMSQDDNRQQVGGGGGRGWRSESEKYRRLSRSCEALSASNKGPRWKKEDADEKVTITWESLPCRITARETALIGRSTLGQDLKQSETPSIGKHGLMPCSQTVAVVCNTKQLSVKESRYAHDGGGPSWMSPKGKTKSGQGRVPTSSTGKQVQFGGVEYEKPKEESVMDKLRNAVSSNRRKLRSRSLERVDRRKERSNDWDSWTGKSKPWDDSITRPRRLCGRERDRTDESVLDNDQQLLKNYKRRSRSRECQDRRDGSQTKHGRGKLYHCDDNQNVILTQLTSWQDDSVIKTGPAAGCGHDQISSDTVTYSDPGTSALQCQALTRNEDPRSASDDVDRNYHSRQKEKTVMLISPQYKAPNGHYGNAVVRKCCADKKNTTRKEQKSAHVKAQTLEKTSPKVHTTFSSEEKRDQRTRQHGRDSERRSSLPKLDKFGISATKIARLDTPLKLTAPDPSILNKIADAPFVSVMEIKDGKDNAKQNTESISADLSSTKSHKDGVESTVESECNSSGYVYNCTTAKITRISRPENSDNWKQQTPNLSISLNHAGCRVSKEKPTSGENGTDHGGCYGEVKKLEPANNLVRQASVASLSLISVNSVDSGTSCHEGSTTDSSASSSDKEMETQGKPNQPASRAGTAKQRLGREARQYRASAKELENLILASCFGVDKHISGLVTSDYESDTGPEMVKYRTLEDGRRRKGGVSRVVRFVGNKDDSDVTREMKRAQQPKAKGEMSASKKSAATIKHPFPTPSIDSHFPSQLTVRACVLNSHKAMSHAEMSVQPGDVVYLRPEDFKQRPLWVMAYSRASGERGLIPSVYLADQLDTLT